MHWQESLPVSIHTPLHSHPLHYSKTSTGYPLNGEYISNWPPWHIRRCTLASHLTCPTCYNIMNPQHTDSAIFLFFSTLCSMIQPWIWLACISNLSTKNLEFIPASIHNSPSLPTFRRHLKTHYFQSAYANPQWPPPLNAPWFCIDLGTL